MRSRLKAIFFYNLLKYLFVIKTKSYTSLFSKNQQLKNYSKQNNDKTESTLQGDCRNVQNQTLVENEKLQVLRRINLLVFFVSQKEHSLGKLEDSVMKEFF